MQRGKEGPVRRHMSEKEEKPLSGCAITGKTGAEIISRRGPSSEGRRATGGGGGKDH